jgi:hypothetical protein
LAIAALKNLLKAKIWLFYNYSGSIQGAFTKTQGDNKNSRIFQGENLILQIQGLLLPCNTC